MRSEISITERFGDSEHCQTGYFKHFQSWILKINQQSKQPASMRTSDSIPRTRFFQHDRMQPNGRYITARLDTKPFISKDRQKHTCYITAQGTIRNQFPTANVTQLAAYISEPQLISKQPTMDEDETYSLYNRTALFQEPNPHRR